MLKLDIDNYIAKDKEGFQQVCELISNLIKTSKSEARLIIVEEPESYPTHVYIKTGKRGYFFYEIYSRNLELLQIELKQRLALIEEFTGSCG